MTALSSLACPQAAGTVDVSPLVAQKYLERLLRLLARDETLASRSDGDIEAMAAPRVSAWRPEVGMATRSAKTGNTSLAALQLACVSGAQALSIRGTVGPGSSLLVDGWLLPVEGEVSVRVLGDTIEIVSSLGSVRLRVEADTASVLDSEKGSAWTVTPMGKRRPRYLLHSGLMGRPGIFPWPTPKQLARRIQSAAVPGPTPMPPAFLEMTEALDQHSPGYADWLSTVVDGVFLTTNADSGAVSSPEFPGLVALGPQDTALDYAESLTSQACHQRLYQLLLVAPLTATDFEEMSYLPSRRTYVTTRRALAAAHEHANVMQMLSGLTSRTDLREEAEARITRRRLLLQTQCLPALERSRSLSGEGSALWLRVRELAGL